MKVIDLKHILSKVLPLDNVSVSDFPFKNDYLANYEKYDKWFYRAYGLKDFFVDDINSINEWNSEVLSVLYQYKEQLSHFWEINTSDYSPIDNVFENRTETIIRDAHTDKLTNGMQTNTDKFGQTTTTDKFGLQTNTDVYGERIDNENLGINDKLGNTVTIVNNREVPYDGLNYKDISETETFNNNSERENKMTKGEQHDEHNVGSRDDEHKTSERNDEHTFGEKIDTSEIGLQKETTEINRHGNIGTTLSTDIMRGSQDFWKQFNFYHELWALINNELFRGEWFE